MRAPRTAAIWRFAADARNEIVTNRAAHPLRHIALRLLVILAALAVLASAAQAAPKSANSGHVNGGTLPSPLSLVSENSWNNPNSPRGAWPKTTTTDASTPEA